MLGLKLNHVSKEAPEIFQKLNHVSKEAPGIFCSTNEYPIVG